MSDSPGSDTVTREPQNVCVLCRLTVLPPDKRLCYRCWRMMPPAERRALAGESKQRPAWVDTGIDKVDS
jgi:predicted amidophosphoribosyltransferase